MSAEPHPELPGRLAATLTDIDDSWPVTASRVVYADDYLTTRVDDIVDPAGEGHRRTIVEHKGAVGVLAFDAHDRVLLVRQYRHPTGKSLVELPAGILDIPGELPRTAAARELAEEGDVYAQNWAELLHLVATPGYSAERWTVFLASELSPVPEAERTVREAEEATLEQWWVPFDAAVDAAMAGEITDSMCVAALLAAAVGRHS